MAKLIFGCGYLGNRVARRWQKAGEQVYVVTRSAAKAAELAARNFLPLVANIAERETLHSLRLLTSIDTVLFTVGWDRTSGQDQRQVYVAGLENVLLSLGEVNRILYISSTGVYGEAEGDWVDEDTPCQPLREGGKCCLGAEQLLRAHELGRKSVVFRLAGIYGPGRVPRIADLQAGRAIAAPSIGFLNLIHVDDAADIVLAAEKKAVLPNMYVVSDGHPVLRTDYYAELARLTNSPPPRFVDPDFNSPSAQRAAANKRIRPDKLFRELDMSLRYPDYRAGLRAIIAAEAAQKPTIGNGEPNAGT